MKVRTIANRLLRPVNLKLVTAGDDWMRLHDYVEGGYEAYRKTQIHWNKAKLKSVVT